MVLYFSPDKVILLVITPDSYFFTLSGCSLESLLEIVPLSTHNVHFGENVTKLSF